MMFIYIIIFIFMLIFLIVVYDSLNRSTRLIRKIPGPKAWPIVGNSFNYVLSPEKLFVYQRSLSKLYGDVNQIHAMNLRMVNISNPQDIEKLLSSPKYIQKEHPYTFLKQWLGDGLLTTGCGAKWQHRRKMLSKGFQFNMLKKYTLTFVEETNHLIERLNDKVGEKQIDILPLISATTLRIMCGAAMGISSDNGIQSSLEPYFQSLHSVGDIYSKRLSKAWLLSERIFQLTDYAKTQNLAISDLHKFTNNVIATRREYMEHNSKEFDDNADDESKRKFSMLDWLLKNEKFGEINHDGIREEVDTFMFAGHDTTAVAMTFMIMVLANEPEIQDKIYSEMLQIFGDTDRSATLEDLNGMKYLECCIKETMRLYPSAVLIARHLAEDTVLGGYTVPADTTCFIDIYEVHHRADIYPDPERFVPERFLPENCAQRHPYAYLSFSGGLRNCIGQKFALLEMKAVMSGLLRKFRLESVTKPTDLVYKTNIVLRTIHPIYVKFCVRN